MNPTLPQPQKRLTLILAILFTSALLCAGVLVYRYIYQTNIAQTPVHVTETQTTSDCFTFTTPKGYRLINSTIGTRSTCKVTLDQDTPDSANEDGTTTTSVGSGQILVRAVAFDVHTVDAFLDKIEDSYPEDTTFTKTHVTIDGRGAGKVAANYQHNTDIIYFIPDPSRKYRSNNKTVTGFVIQGSTYANRIDAIDTIVRSFHFK